MKIAAALIMSLWIAGFLQVAFLVFPLRVYAATSTVFQSREELEREIRSRARELNVLRQAIEETKKTLTETKSERMNLQRAIAELDRTIGQLEVSIKADAIAVEKLGLEIEMLGYDIRDIEVAVEEKRSATAEVLRELQRSDRIQLLTVLLRDKSFAENVFDIRALGALKTRLTQDAQSLRDLRDALEGKLEEVREKRLDIEYRKANLENRKVIMQDQKEERRTLLAQTKSRENVYEQQVKELEKRQREIATEIEQLEAVLRKKIDPGTLPAARPGLLAMPLAADRGDITQDYGATEFARYGYRGKWHNGVDIRAPVGTPITAAEDGIVVAVGNQDSYCYKGAYGRFIVINHSNNLTTLYAHLSRYVVKAGQSVKRGEVIGYSGKSGYATGPHLHFTVFAQPTFYMGSSKSCGPMPYGGDLNPLLYL